MFDAKRWIFDVVSEEWPHWKCGIGSPITFIQSQHYKQLRIHIDIEARTLLYLSLERERCMCAESAVNSMTCLFRFWTANSAFQHNYRRARTTQADWCRLCAWFVYMSVGLRVYVCIRAWVYQLTFYFVCVSFSSFAFLENILLDSDYTMMMFGFKICNETKNEFVQHSEFIYSTRFEIFVCFGSCVLPLKQQQQQQHQH